MICIHLLTHLFIHWLGEGRLRVCAERRGAPTMSPIIEAHRNGRACHLGARDSLSGQKFLGMDRRCLSEGGWSDLA